jgi:S1-C subfamily serine protease
MGIGASLIALALYGAMQPKVHQLDTADVTRSIASALASQTPGPALSESVYLTVAPSVVTVRAEYTGASASPGSSSAVPGPASAATPSSSGIPAAASTGTTELGSGVIVDDAGDILTALHVVSGAGSIQVTFADGSVAAATIAAAQPTTDIAVLQAARMPASFVPAVLGNPRAVQVGAEAYVVGNPFGLTGSMTSGVISALGRSFQMPDGGPVLTGLIQIDAAVNPGNSGGPLVNRDGQVVGIVTALVNPTNQGVFIGIGLAVPIDVAAGGGPGQLPQY